MVFLERNMWLQHFIVLLSTAFLVDGQDECPEHVIEFCGTPIRDLKFPTCDSELEDLCMELKSFAECVISYREQCPSSMSGPSLEFAQSLLRTGTTFCTTDSAWFKGAVKYGSCYDHFLRYHDITEKCSPDKVNKTNLALSNVPDLPGIYQCYIDITTAVCVIDTMSRLCGKMATELGVHFLNGVGFWNVYCLNHKDTALKMMEEYEFTINPETTEEEFVTLFENISDSYGSNKNICLSNYKNLCPNPGDFIYDFPENSADLSARCKAHIKYKECLIDYEEKCGEKIWGMSLYEDMETLNTFCNEDSALFQALSVNGKCFNKLSKVFDTDAQIRIFQCKDQIRNKDPEKYELEYNQRYPEDYHMRFCFHDLQLAKCLADALLEDCGEIAKELMLQALKLNKLEYTLCKNFLKEAEFFMKELDFSLDTRYSLEDFVNLLENESEAV